MLTPAEWRVVEAVRHGMANRQIAARRGISADAVKYHLANALAKLGLSTRAELKHWHGVARASALTKQEPTMQNVTLGPIGQIARVVSDIEAARHFYGEVLGLPHLYSFGALAFYDCGGVRLMLSSEAGSDGGNSILYFRVTDIRAAHAQLAERGVGFLGAPHRIHRHDDGTEEWMAFFRDPDGGTLALIAQVKS